MKTPLFICFIITIFSFTTVAQPQGNKKEKLEFCGNMLETPSECMAETPHQVTCKGGAMQWVYLESDMLTFMPQQYLAQLEEKLKKFRKKSIVCLSFGNELSGYKISYKDSKDIKYKIIAYGTVNGQAVLLSLDVDQEPINNEMLPSFAKEIIKLKE